MAEIHNKKEPAFRLVDIGLVVVTLLFFAGCQSTPKVIIAPGKILTKHSFTDLEGNTVDIKNYLGKPLLINYWATWCKFCLKDLPIVDEFAQSSDKQTVVLLSDEPIEKIKQFKNTKGYNLIYLKSDKKLTQYGIRQRPAFGYFSATGKHLETINGSGDLAILKEMVSYHKNKK